MQKLVLISILVVTIVCPVLAAREANPRRALRNALVWTMTGIAVYVLAVLFLYPRFQG